MEELGLKDSSCNLHAICIISYIFVIFNTPRMNQTFDVTGRKILPGSNMAIEKNLPWLTIHGAKSSLRPHFTMARQCVWTISKYCIYILIYTLHTTRKVNYRHEKNRGINTKIIDIDTCCNYFEIIVARCDNKYGESVLMVIYESEGSKRLATTLSNDVC